MHARRVALAALAGATIALSLAAAPGELIRFEFDEPHMGTTFRIVLYASDAGSAASASSEAFDRIADLDRRLTDYGEDSELMRACRQAVGRHLPVSPDVFRVLDAAHRLAERAGRSTSPRVR
jgi:thiamine biosynthesis lipoprotein